MNFFLFHHSYPLLLTLSMTPIMAWDWRGRTETSSSTSCSCAMPTSCSLSDMASCPTTTPNTTNTTKALCPFQSNLFNVTTAENNSTESQGICWEAMMYKELDLSNITAIHQPPTWDPEYQSIRQFCQSRGNGTFCYAKGGDCLAMAVVRCPEGILSSCRAGFMCQAMQLDGNVTCSINQPDNNNCTNSFNESGRAACWAIPDVLQIPPAQNISTTTDTLNNTITVGKQVLGYPFYTTTSTTVDCTMTCASSLPTWLPQPTEKTQVCLASGVEYSVPGSTCAGPYPPGPMTTITACLSASESEKVMSPSASESSMTSMSSETIMPMESTTMPSSMPSTTSEECPSTSAPSSSSIMSSSSMAGYATTPPVMFDYGDGDGEGYYGNDNKYDKYNGDHYYQPSNQDNQDYNKQYY